MSKKSVVARNNKRIKLEKKYREKRIQLKKDGKWDELQSLPRNASPTRIKNRCFITGRGRGFLRAFGLSRISFREHARNGNIPGIRKSSW